MQSGWGEVGVNAGGLGGRTDGNFHVRSELTDQKFEKMWYGGSTCVALSTEGELWGVAFQNTLTFGDSTRNWTFDELEQVPFNVNELEDIQISGNSVFYLLKDGKVWFTGDRNLAGMSGVTNESGTGFILINDGNGSSLPELNTLCGGKSNYGELIKNSVDNYNQSTNNIFIGKDGKLYMTNNANLMFGDNQLQKNWIRIATDVCYFDPLCPAYINSKKELFVAGNNSSILGLGNEYSNVGKVSQFTKVLDSRIDGKVKKFEATNNNSYALTEDGILYGTGFYSTGGENCYAGWNEKDNYKSFVQILDNIVDFEVRGNNRVAFAKNNIGYGWGDNWGALCGVIAQNALVPVEFNLDDLEFSSEDIRQFCFCGSYKSLLVTNSGSLFIGGNWSGKFDGGFNKSLGGFQKYTYNMSFLGEDEKIVQIASINDATAIGFTNKGRVFGYGAASSLGKNSTSGELIDMGLLGIDNVVSITAGSGCYIVIKADGTVWGTGNNSTGILGRWSGSDRKKPNSRYQTAYEWVECPELEL